MNSLVGAESILWQIFPEVALVLWSSMPSAVKEIALYRNTLISMLELKPPSFCVSSLLVIRPLVSFVPPLPIGAIYVGSGSVDFSLKPSVWLNPCDFVDVVGSPLVVYYKIASLRPDLLQWLSPLARASVLVCDCLSSSCGCHAGVLKRLLEEYSDKSLKKSSSVGMENDEEVLCPECDPAEEEADEDLVVNETLRGSSVDTPVGYPSSWTEVIRKVRRAPQRIFWESNWNS